MSSSALRRRGKSDVRALASVWKCRSSLYRPSVCFTRINWTRARRWSPYTIHTSRCWSYVRGEAGGPRGWQRGGQIKATQRNNQCSLRVITLFGRADCFKGVTRIGQLRYCALLNCLPYYIIWFGVASGSSVGLGHRRGLLTILRDVHWFLLPLLSSTRQPDVRFMQDLLRLIVLMQM